ncbi:MAG: hypothetical protein EBT33_12410 [Betaproteobacteria bacterium]|nr:hypothetical protein [Betaproteobacteria bacterium]
MAGVGRRSAALLLATSLAHLFDEGLPLVRAHFHEALLLLGRQAVEPGWAVGRRCPGRGGCARGGCCT